MCAVENQHVEIATILAAYEDRLQDNKGWTALMRAAKNNTLAKFPFLVELEHSIADGKKWTSMMYAASKGHLEVVEALLPYEGMLQDYEGRQRSL